MDYYRLFKVAVTAAAVGIAAYGAYRGYTATKAVINSDKVARKNAATMAKIAAMAEQRRKAVSATTSSSEAIAAFEVAVTTAKETTSVATDVKVASFRTGFVCGEEEIIRAKVAVGDRQSPTELARKSFYAAIVTVAKNHSGTEEEFDDVINSAIIQTVEQAVASNKISLEQLHEWINTSNIELRSFYVPTIKEIKKAAMGTDAPGLIDRLIKLDLAEEEKIRKLISQSQGDGVIEAPPCDIEVEIEMITS